MIPRSVPQPAQRTRNPGQPDCPTVTYGALVVSRPPRVCPLAVSNVTRLSSQWAGKANTLVADQVFTLGPVTGLEIGRVDVKGRYEIERGCGAGVPSLVATSLQEGRGPALVDLTGYPDPDLQSVLLSNVGQNEAELRCPVHTSGYAWGQHTAELLSLLPSGRVGYDILLLADLVHLTPPISPHVTSLTALLARTPDSRVYVSVGACTRQPLVDAFLRAIEQDGLAWEEWVKGDEWEGCDMRGVGEVEGRDGMREVKRGVSRWVVR